ncbi:MarR family winged helix-turn-helix transcriptional regulator [Brenneria goodwinii]|uniref:Transcriptional regulator, MarR family n=1 Tax=Brenneria goodwinii TaxID=1109412 RepID=A0A0G4JZV7_9GAMM|nr:MarR family transcriptional regulator [Brenneria goodwinii]CPR19673.1 Transcriptional regulator, MarR family [Brenneria goodwinii]
MFENTLFHVIRVILQEHTARWSTLMPDLTKPQYAVLEALDREPELDQLSLGQASATTRATLTEMLARMEKRGLIERRTDEKDGRQKRVTITPEGRKMLLAARPVADRVTDSLIYELSPEELAQLQQLLQKMLRQARKQEKFD